jgi:hypothetical protein
MTPNADAIASLHQAKQAISRAHRALTIGTSKGEVLHQLNLADLAVEDAISVLPDEPQEAHRGR